MGNCISDESEEVRRSREISRKIENQEWEKRYREFCKKSKTDEHPGSNK